MILSIVISLSLFGLCGLIHYAVMRSVLNRVAQSRLRPLSRMMAGFYSAGFAHLVEAALYAMGFGLGRSLGLGAFHSNDGPVEAMQLYYFSLVNYTSLGLGDIYPTGHLRFMAGVESLNGFLLISCSAAFIFVLMTKE